jgi:uncharacterized protein YeaO (DUF488 family)
MNILSISADKMLQIKRVYETPQSSDGYRIFVDRLWPRGMTKERAAVDLWLKDIAPSAELRTWFGHDPAKFTEFRQLYRNELVRNPQLQELKKVIRQHTTVTLLYAAKDIEINDAVVLKEFLQG